MGAPNVWGKYRLLRRLGVGGMAEVYLAEVDGPGGFVKRLAIKRILPHLAEQELFILMFFNEARLAAQLEHPNLVQIFELGEIDGIYYLAMEYADGPSLRGLLRRSVELRKPMPLGLAAKMVALACEGLAYAHDLVDGEGKPLGLVHRDVNPDNILTSRSGAVKVADFGIAKAKDQSSLTQLGAVKGKALYMSPEQVMGEQLDRRADVYALGVVLYELLTWLVPFAGTAGADLAGAIVGTPAEPVQSRRPDCPDELARIVERAIAKARRDRYPDCAAFRGDLERFLVGRGEVTGATEIAQWVTELAPPPRDEPGLTVPADPASQNPRRCPLCGVRLAIAFAGGLAVDGCESCGGLWLDSGELQALGNRPGALSSLHSRFHPRARAQTHRSEGPCPACAGPLTAHELASLAGIPIERCRQCEGVWLGYAAAHAVDRRLGA